MMEGERLNLIKVWLSVIFSLCCCYALRKRVVKGTRRLLFVLPVVCLFLYLPLTISSVNLRGVTGFFIAWLANFKLLLFAFGKGPLSLDPSISLPLFLAVACLPINIQNPPIKSHLDGQRKENGRSVESTTPGKRREGPLNYALKGVVVALLIRVYDYSAQIHPTILLVLYAFHIYFVLDILLVLSASLARAMLGVDLEPQFNEPYLATSLQDFWGRRWNLMVSRILHPTVYEPIRVFGTRAVGPKWAALPAVLGTFAVSGMMHELIFYYLGLMRPTWECMFFFLLHGLCLAVEIAVKKVVNGRWALPGVVTGILTVGFVMMTGFWLFLPKFVVCEIDVRAIEEYEALMALGSSSAKKLVRVVTGN